MLFIHTGFDVKSKWAAWKTSEGQTGGYATEFASGNATIAAGNRFRFKTVHGAGHMCPSTRPAQTLELLENFLAASL